MATLRFSALKEVLKRKPIEINFPKEKISEYFGINVFDNSKMQKHLSKEAFLSIQKSIDKKESIDRKIASQVANAMKEWALSRGVTHYTHWFHPLTDASTEKHDAFFDFDKSGIVLENFDGDKLAQQEPDASSFPSGGIRNTFEARGYTAWDPSSPAFIIDKTLCIPTIFISYTGEALDYKTPLLRSAFSLNNSAVKVCKLFNTEVEKVFATLGWEQEYFLIDEALYQARPDIVLTERTLMGHSSSKDQQLDDHYFGSIPERVSAYMQEFEIESHKLGIPIKTRHNEVAPNQFECAPIFEEVNLAVDHNQLLMDIMIKIARHHNFRVLLHEKPFKSVNGSGKHNNWSMSTDSRINLLSPGKEHLSNLRFLTFLINTVKAVHDNADLLRASISSAGNEHRLGANEAPPAIMSVFLGSKLTEILNKIENSDFTKLDDNKQIKLKLEIESIPEILLDNTDRNRTSPFAFTGNRFEFRAVGSTANCSSPMLVLNTAVSNQLNIFYSEVDELQNSGIEKEEAILKVLKDCVIASKKIRFEGNGYGEEWIKEASLRGLTNITNVPEAIEAYISEKSVNMFEKHKVLNKRELFARYEVLAEKYMKKIQIESRVLGDLAINHIVPTAIKYQNILIQNVKGLKDICANDEFKTVIDERIGTINIISEHISSIKNKVNLMTEERRLANLSENFSDKARIYNTKVKPFLEDIRNHIDSLELIVDDEIWCLPKYRELLFSR
jgi:glutamine synthetase